MRRGEIFWGAILVALGGLLFLKTAGYLAGDVLSWFWPLLIAAAGAWILLGGFRARPPSTSSALFVIPSQNAHEASLTINHGAGRLELRSGASGADFLRGNSAAGLSHSSHMVGERLAVSIDAGPSVLPFIGPDGGVWIVQINPAIPTQIVLHDGASNIVLDLAELQISRLDYDGGASSMKLSLPARAESFSSRIRTGASSIEIRVPDGVAARFVTSSPASLSIDQKRFPPAGDGVFQSSGFDIAPRRAEVTIDGDATSIRVEQELT